MPLTLGPLGAFSLAERRKPPGFTTVTGRLAPCRYKVSGIGLAPCRSPENPTVISLPILSSRIRENSDDGRITFSVAERIALPEGSEREIQPCRPS
jgi:hypothetical protein